LRDGAQRIQIEHQGVPAEIDLTQSESGKLHRRGQHLNLPVYLDDLLQARLADLATAEGVELSALVNEWLRKDLERLRNEQ
jgi:hypothetical protein